MTARNSWKACAPLKWWKTTGTGPKRRRRHRLFLEPFNQIPNGSCFAIFTPGRPEWLLLHPSMRWSQHNWYPGRAGWFCRSQKLWKLLCIYIYAELCHSCSSSISQAPAGGAEEFFFTEVLVRTVWAWNTLRQRSQGSHCFLGVLGHAKHQAFAFAGCCAWAEWHHPCAWWGQEIWQKARGTWMQWIPISICNSSKVLCQVEAMKTALDWRALVADVLTMERRSRGTRWANTQQARDNIKKWIWICDDARNCINRIMDMVQSVLDVRIKC